MRAGTWAAPSDMTVGDWITTWLESRRRGPQAIQPGTWAKYEANCRVHILPSLGRVRLHKLTRAMCQQFINKLECAPKTVRNIAGTLTKALNDAFDAELIPRNPAEHLRLPGIVHKPPVVMDTDTERMFEAEFKKSPYGNIYAFALGSGMRISEVLGLRWRDVDMQTGEVRVNGQLERSYNGADRRRKDTTKTHRDRAPIMPPYVIDILKAERTRQTERRLLAGEMWNNPDGFVFTREDGSPMPHRTVEHAFGRIAERLGHPEVTLHCLRRTNITDRVHDGDDVKVIADAVGHSSIAMTLGTYTGTRPEDLRRSADRQQRRHDTQNRPDQ